LERQAFETHFNATVMAEAAADEIEKTISRRCGRLHSTI